MDTSSGAGNCLARSEESCSVEQESYRSRRNYHTHTEEDGHVGPAQQSGMVAAELSVPARPLDVGCQCVELDGRAGAPGCG